MITSLSQGVGRVLAVLTIPLLASSAQAQWGRFGDPCGTCASTAAIAPPQYAAAPIAYNPCMQQVAVATACPCMQPVTETVYRDVPVTQYVAVKKTVKKPVLKTVYEDRPVTAYKQEMETRVAEVPTVSYQTVQECRPVTIDRSHWQTVYQPIQKVSPCQYDPRPGFAGWANRTSYNMRMAFTPNQIRQRQFVPNVQMVSIPQNRTVAIPGTRQVTYNVAKMVPYETTERVARVITDYEDVEVTAYEPTDRDENRRRRHHDPLCLCRPVWEAPRLGRHWHRRPTTARPRRRFRRRRVPRPMAFSCETMKHRNRIRRLSSTRRPRRSALSRVRRNRAC